jgi:hypothetical protein
LSTEEQREEEEPPLLMDEEEESWRAAEDDSPLLKVCRGLSGDESIGSHLDMGPRSSSMRMSSRFTRAEYFRSRALLLLLLPPLVPLSWNMEGERFKKKRKLFYRGIVATIDFSMAYLWS